MNEANDPRRALDALEAIDERLAQRMRWPLWRHMAAGLLMSLIVAAAGVPRNLAAAAFAAGLVLVLVIVRDDKKRHGMFVSGYQRGRTKWVVAAIILTTLSAVLVVRTQLSEGIADPLFWVVLAIVFSGTTMLSLLWERVYGDDIRRGAV